MQWEIARKAGKKKLDEWKRIAAGYTAKKSLKARKRNLPPPNLATNEKDASEHQDGRTDLPVAAARLGPAPEQAEHGGNKAATEDSEPPVKAQDYLGETLKLAGSWRTLKTWVGWMEQNYAAGASS